VRHHPCTFHSSSRPLQEQLPISTVNNAEIAHFSRLSRLWWDEQGEFALLHKMNAHRMRFIREKLLLASTLSHPAAPVTAPTRASSEPSHPLAGLDVLDVGCGGGILSEASFIPIIQYNSAIRMHSPALADIPNRA